MDAVITPQTATLIAACVASLLSFITLIVNVLSTRSAAQREALRKTLYEDVNDLGNQLYRCVAMSKNMVDTNSDDSFEEYRTKAAELQSQINKIRGRVRYSLRGLDSGIREVRATLFYILQLKNQRKDPVAARIITLSTKLRKSLDSAIFRALVIGRPPTRFQLLVIRYRAWKLRSCFEQNDPRKSAATNHVKNNIRH